MEVKPEDTIVSIYKGRNDSISGWNMYGETAVRIYHKPSGIEVSSDIRGDVYNNKAVCMELLQAKLAEDTPVIRHTKCPALEGETWYIRLPHACSLVKAIVADVTDHTIELYLTATTASRYKISDIEFVELA